jgi:hypothetical protein
MYVITLDTDTYKESTTKIYLSLSPTPFRTPLHTPQLTPGQLQQYAERKRQRKILTTEHPAAYVYLHNKFLDTIVKILSLNNIHVTGSRKTHKIVMTRY